MNFIDQVTGGPGLDPRDEEGARVGLERWCEAAETLDDGGAAARAMVAEGPGRDLLRGIFANSPYLTQICLREQATMVELAAAGPTALFETIVNEAAALDAANLPVDRLMRALRLMKRRASLCVAVADITDSWPLAEITRALTRMAETALAQAFRHALATTVARGRLPLTLGDDPLVDSGLICLAMGKMGAYELNYSSDIDLIVFYDNEHPALAGFDEVRRGFVEVTRVMVRIMEERTAEGYVFRTDLRLRPDAGATPIAISTAAAEAYYESAGQNWERAAMIKARPVASDQVAAGRFMKRIEPFIWRKYLDFAAIQDIHSIKRQIAVHKGGGQIAVNGHNLKLGRGGIREIEFFAQTQQLIWGGRSPRLRVAPTLAALAGLVQAGRTSAAAATDLTAAYGFLRRAEHRLQMIADAQTHSLPSDDAAVARFAAFLGYPTVATFQDDLLRHLNTVAQRYGALFEEAPSLAADQETERDHGNLVFTGTESDPDTVATLEAMGFDDGEAVAMQIRQWHHGRYRATRSERSRQLLTELMPRLLAGLAGSAEPNAAFRRFDRFLMGLPAGVQVFSLLYQNPWLLEIIAKIMGMAPSLSEYLSRHPEVFEGILTHDSLRPIADSDDLVGDLADQFAAARDYEHRLDLTRRWVADRRFQIGVQLLRQVISGDQAATALSRVAEAAIVNLLPAAADDLAARHGRIGGDGPAMAVLALGKLGGRELTFASDLDLIFVYDAPFEAVSDGAKPLAASVYFTRLGQRLLTALTVQTGEGELFDVDMRLRPDGQKAPLAVSREGFENYHRDNAWTWEKMALTRARAIAGPTRLQADLADFIRADLAQPSDGDALLRDIADMRVRVARERSASGPWDAKNRRGGLLDIEFITQYLLLRHAHASPEVLDGNTATALTKLTAAGHLTPDQGRLLSEAAGAWQRLQGILRLTLHEVDDRTDLPDDLKARMVAVSGAADFAALERRLAKLADDVAALYAEIIAEPAARRAATDSDA